MYCVYFWTSRNLYVSDDAITEDCRFQLMFLIIIIFVAKITLATNIVLNVGSVTYIDCRISS